MQEFLGNVQFTFDDHENNIGICSVSGVWKFGLPCSHFQKQTWENSIMIMVKDKTCIKSLQFLIHQYNENLLKQYICIVPFKDIMNSMTSISSEVNVSTGNASCYQHVGELLQYVSYFQDARTEKGNHGKPKTQNLSIIYF